jgi:general stress protein 26
MTMADKDTPQEVAAKFIDKLKASPFVMIGLNDGRHSEPMTAQIDDDQPNTLFFFAGRDNRIAKGGAAMAQFVGKGHDFFACMAGNVSTSNDRTQIDKLWNNQVEAWFPGGKEDPNLTLLRFDIDSAELWETDISVGGRLKMLFGGTIRSDESSSHAVVNSIA